MLTPLLTIQLFYSCLTTATLILAPPFRAAQQPMMHEGPGIAVPHNPSSADTPISDAVIISDVMGRDRSISIFASLSRDVESVSVRLADAETNSTILAPLNTAVAALPRKPWEDAQDYSELGTNAYEGMDGEGRAQRNLKKFVEAHVVKMSPWAVGEKVEALAGNVVWFEERDGHKFIQPGDVEVLSVADKVFNGEVWILKGPLNYAS